MKNKICATVILYNPDETIFNNINSYAHKISKLIVVDNSEIQNKEIITNLLSKYINIEYINNHKNLGIATALNIACNKAIELDMNWILTMDQDSKFINFQSYLNCFFTIIKEKSDIGIITSNHTGNITAISKSKECLIVKQRGVITSGNIINLKHFNKNISFDDKLFIDMVDYDFSNKLIINKLNIYLLQNHYILHHIGEIFQHKNLITKKIKSKIEHNPQRVYYMTRNRLYLSKKYAKDFPKDYNILKTINILFIHDITKILLYEDNKRAKLKAKLIGLYHFLIGKYGRYDIK